MPEEKNDEIDQFISELDAEFGTNSKRSALASYTTYRPTPRLRSLCYASFSSVANWRMKFVLAKPITHLQTSLLSEPQIDIRL